MAARKPHDRHIICPFFLKPPNCTNNALQGKFWIEQLKSKSRRQMKKIIWNMCNQPFADEHNYYHKKIKEMIELQLQNHHQLRKLLTLYKKSSNAYRRSGLCDCIKKIIKTVECPICLDILTQEIRMLKCGHSFHTKCIFSWLTVNRTCPTCREPATEPVKNLVANQIQTLLQEQLPMEPPVSPIVEN